MKRINELFKPSKIKLIGKSKIIETPDGHYVIKKKQQDIKSLYDYLSIRDFNNYPQITHEVEDNYVYEHLKEVKVPHDQKASDMASLLASLHQKTLYNKPITADNIKKVYEDIQNNILYMEKFYLEFIDKIKTEVIMSPSHYLLIRNSSKLLSTFNYCKKEVDVWLKQVEGHTKERVVYCHNNLSIDHYIKGATDAFISWDHYCVDTPILDLINLYKQDWSKYDFSNFIEIYNNQFPLTDEEKRLFFIIISLPYEIALDKDEFTNTRIINNLLTYLYKTEILIRSNYSPQNIKE